MSIEERIRTYCKVNHLRLCDFANRIGMHTLNIITEHEYRDDTGKRETAESNGA